VSSCWGRQKGTKRDKEEEEEEGEEEESLCWKRMIVDVVEHRERERFEEKLDWSCFQI
jgi:hypothetical protein